MPQRESRESQDWARTSAGGRLNRRNGGPGGIKALQGLALGRSPPPGGGVSWPGCYTQSKASRTPLDVGHPIPALSDTNEAPGDVMCSVASPAVSRPGCNHCSHGPIAVLVLLRWSVVESPTERKDGIDVLGRASVASCRVPHDFNRVTLLS